MGETFCPATMCPLFAPDGSPWTGDKNSHCQKSDCLWFDDGHCGGADAAFEQITNMEAHGGILLAGPVTAKKASVEPKSFDCPRAAECQWQLEAGDDLCPPRRALQQGIDPRACAY